MAAQARTPPKKTQYRNGRPSPAEESQEGTRSRAQPEPNRKDTGERQMQESDQQGEQQPDGGGQPQAQGGQQMQGQQQGQGQQGGQGQESRAPQQAGNEQQGQEDQEGQAEGGSDSVTNVLDLDIQPINLDLLGLVVSTDEIHLSIDAEAGDGKLVGNLVGQLSTLLNTLDLSALSGQVTETAQNTVKGLAGEASNQVQEKGSELIRSATESLGGYLQKKMPGTSGQEQSASAGGGEQ